MKYTAALLVSACCAAGSAAAAPVDFTGDVRVAAFGVETRNRVGATTDDQRLRARARIGAAYAVADGWRFAARFAMVVDTEQVGTRYLFQPSAPTPDGVLAGDATFDELYADYAPAGSAWTVRAGRFQTNFELTGVAPKSLDRNDSPNLDITWTDGAWIRHHGARWTAHFIAQHNHPDGTSNAQRPPLWFDGGGSRATLFAALAANETQGRWVQRVVSVTWAPGALRPEGVANAARVDYLAVTARAAAAWPVGDAGMRFIAALEAGYAPNTPRRTILGSGTGDANGYAWQGSLNLVDFAPAHNVGLVYGRVADGWLVSSDFRPNESLVELRWAWRVAPAWTVDARVRRRVEIDLPYANLVPRRSDDLTVRTTFRF